MNQSKIEEWKLLITQQKASGLSIIDWCLENNYTEAAYHYWRRKIGKNGQNNSESQVTFAKVMIPQVTNPSPAGLHLTWKDLQMDITSKEEAGLAVELLRLLQTPC